MSFRVSPECAHVSGILMRVSHYFTDTQAATNAETESLSFSARGFDFDVKTASSVFSAHRLDLGTASLLKKAPPLPESGLFLDLGCGWGPLALAMAKERPQAHVWGVDVNTRALELTRQNARVNGCSNLTVLTADEALARAQEESLQFDCIWSNPPIRVGKDALQTMITQWMQHLSPNGQAWLVIARNLGADSFQRWAAAQGWDAQRAASKKGYRILRIMRNA